MSLATPRKVTVNALLRSNQTKTDLTAIALSTAQDDVEVIRFGGHKVGDVVAVSLWFRHDDLDQVIAIAKRVESALAHGSAGVDALSIDGQPVSRIITKD